MKSEETFDRRKYPRVMTESLVSIARVDSPGMLASALDLSAGGIRFQCVGLDLELGETIRVELTLNRQTVCVVGELVRVTDLDGFTQEVALTFLHIDPAAMQLLDAVLPESS